MKNLMLDTSAYAYFKRGHAGVVHTLREVNAILMPAIVIGELFAVLKSGNQRQKNRVELNEFVKSPRVSVVDITKETAERYAKIYAYLRSEGRHIPTNNLWVAASAMEHSAELLTMDSHFLELPQIFVQQFTIE